MKKLYFSLATFSVFAALLVVGFGTSAQSDESAVNAPAVSPNFVISQFQVQGGNQQDEFIELHNTSSTSVDLAGFRVVYRSFGGVNDVAMVEWTSSTVIPAGGFYLISSGASYDGPVPAQISYNTSMVSMSASGGGIGIRNGASNTGALIDSVGYGSATNIFVEGTPAAAPAANNSQARNQNGCADTDSNANDFISIAPSAPRNTSTAPFICSGTGTTLFASISANPGTISPPGSTLLAVAVIPATTPPSTGISVVGDLTNVGGSASQPFFDNGTNGDQTAGDNVFSYTVTFAAGTPGGSRTVTAIASDAQGRTVNLTQNLTVNVQTPVDNPLLFGNPSDATGDVANENNYLMQKPQYTLSYNRSKATANWVAWRLDTSWLGPVQRSDDFREDPTLPAGWYRVQDNDYSGSGQTRGHMVSSGERTNTAENNSATFLMTNIVPQISSLNSGPWNNFEMYLIQLAQQGNEIYTISGPSGNAGTIGSTAQNRIVVPTETWKVVLILPNGSDDLRRVTKATRVFGVRMSNISISSSAPWRNFRVTVDEVERLTGFDFFSEIPKNTQELLERRRDNQ